MAELQNTNSGIQPQFLTKEQARTILGILNELKESKAFKNAENSPDLKKNNFKKPTYEEFVKNARTYSKMSYGGALRQVWNQLDNKFQQSGLSRKMLDRTDVARSIYNELFFEPGAFAREYNLEQVPQDEKVTEAPVVAGQNSGDTPMSEENKVESDGAAGQAAESPTVERQEYDAEFWQWLEAEGITKDAYATDDSLVEKVAKLRKKYEEQKMAAEGQAGAAPAETEQGSGAAGEEEGQGEEKEEESASVNGELEFVDDEQQPEAQDWIEEYNQYLTKYGEEKGNPWTCESKEGGLSGHFEKGPNFSYSAPNKMSFSYAEDGKPSAEDFMGPLSLAKEKGQKLSWNREMSQEAREAVMQACAKVGLDIVGLDEEEQKKFDELRGQKTEEKTEEKVEEKVAEAPAESKAKSKLAEMRQRINARDDLKTMDERAAALRQELCDHADSLGINKNTMSVRRYQAELRAKGATTWGKSHDDDELRRVEILDMADRLSNPGLSEARKKDLEQHKRDMETIAYGEGSEKEAAIGREKKRDEDKAAMLKKLRDDRTHS